jgi:hypothetical protein
MGETKMSDIFSAGASAGPVGSNISDYTSLVPGSKGADPSLLQNAGLQAQGFSDAYKGIAGGLQPQQQMQPLQMPQQRPQVQLQQQDLLGGVRSMGGNK